MGGLLGLYIIECRKLANIEILYTVAVAWLVFGEGIAG